MNKREKMAGDIKKAGEMWRVRERERESKVRSL